MRAVWCLLTVSLVVVHGDNVDDVVIVPPARASAIAQASSKCVEELNIEKIDMQKYFAFELSDTESSRKYVYCIGTGTGYIASDGSIIRNEVLEVVGAHGERVGGVIDECNKLKYSDKYEAAFRILMCFNEKLRLRFKF